MFLLYKYLNMLLGRLKYELSRLPTHHPQSQTLLRRVLLLNFSGESFTSSRYIHVMHLYVVRRNTLEGLFCDKLFSLTVLLQILSFIACVFISFFKTAALVSIL